MRRLVQALLTVGFVLVVLFGLLQVWTPHNLAICENRQIGLFRLEVSEVGVVPRESWMSNLSPYAKTKVYGGLSLAFNIWMGNTDACGLTPI